MTPDNTREIEHLKSKINILEEENNLLSDRAEEVMLLGLVAESISALNTEEDVYENVLERISLLCDIPFCACCSVDKGKINLIASYASFYDDDLEVPDIKIKLSVILGMTKDFVILTEDDFTDEPTQIIYKGLDITPKSTLVIPYASSEHPNGFFLFADREVNEKLSPKVMLLQQIIDMTVYKTDNLNLIDKMQLLNKTLDKKVEDRTGELKRSNELMQASRDLQSKFINGVETKELYEYLLEKIIEITDSEFGFVSELKFDEEERPYLKAFAITNIAWDESSTQFYEENINTGVEFTSLDNLFGEVVITSKPVISNNPSKDPRSKGLPEGHPPLNSFMGIPLASADKMAGVIGLANRPGGFDEELVNFLTPFLTTYTSLILANQTKTERYELQKKLEVSRRMESLGVLAGGVAHDLNNILGPLLAYPELILSNLEDDSPIISDVLQIKDSAQRAADVVGDLLTLSRRGRYQMENIGLNTLIENYLKTAEFIDEQNRFPSVKLKTNLASDLLNIDGSKAHLPKIIMNLVNNAFESMDKGGVLELTTENQYLERTKIADDEIKEGEYAILKVRDQGVGIKKEDQSRIFEPFFTRKELGSRSGTGLGLAVVWGIVKDHGGFINVESKVGYGTTMMLYFPISRKEKLIVSKSTKNYTGNEKILVVDDDEKQRDLAKRMLSHYGYDVDSAVNGHEAINYLKNQSVDLVILDMIMDRGFDGLETYRKIIELKPGQKAIIVSGFSETNRVKEAINLGVGSYLRKPYTLDQIGKPVREELDRK